MRNQSIDLFKFIFSFFVVAIHVSVLFPDNYTYRMYFVNGFLRVAVPFFMVVSCYFVKENVNEWAKKLLKLYLFWSVIYFPFWGYDALNSQNFSWFNFSLTITKNLIFGYHHLWYLAAIIPAMIIYTYLKSIFSNRNIILLCIFLYLFGFLSQEYSGLLSELERSKSIIRYEFIYKNFIFYAFPIIGVSVFLKNKNLKMYTKFDNAKLVIIFSIILLIEILVRAYLCLNSKADYLITAPFFSFFLVKYLIELKTSSKLYFTKFLSIASEKIYFIHPIIIYLTFKVI